ncbi:hypothetical protein QSJ19_24395 [Gordonia sp. ABSL11-1]|uniref:DUF6777 domain-containing protein n=1 Tax=Gordonia sp. ABSL11-1 TaxID=3053924 RepID=UPI002572F5ED|nr:DUF6777 domain-containing protein [Gordonia sp. ABSL11-1]MDL9948668.1 hypothetical protein [Gordonia sp. ABSL11-1]
MTFPDNSAPYPTLPTAPDSAGAKRNKTLILGAVVAVLALVVASIVVLTVKSDGNPLTPALRLLGIGDTQQDPFTPSVALTNRALPEGIQLASTRGAQDRGVRVVNGTEQGLYGAGGTASCDVAALGNSLANDPSSARAWASVFGINPSDIPYYLNTLTPVVLTADTWVTNHTYHGGSANAFQSVLQAGTPVLVDGAGVPRAVCSCGNPLAPPAATPVGGYRVAGTTWPGYQTNRVVRVAYHTENVTVVNNTTVVAPAPNPAASLAAAALSLINVDNAQLFTRQVGNVLDLDGVPPLTAPLPTPADLNVPFAAGSDEEAERNGLAGAGSTQAAAAVEERAAADGDNPQMSSATGESAPAVATRRSTSEGTSAAAPSERPRPTAFTGSGGQVGSLSFDDGGTTVTCTVPIEPSTDASLTLRCSDSVDRGVYALSLLSAAVRSATDSDGVWSISLTPVGRTAADVDVASAVWRELPETTTSTTSPTPAETTTETTAPEVTETPTVETTTPEVETSTAEPTVEATTEETTTEETTTTTPPVS